MNRRSFFGMFSKFSVVTAAGILLPEAVKTYFFMPGIEREVEWITRETLKLLMNKIEIQQRLANNFYSSFPVGETVKVRLPARFSM